MPESRTRIEDQDFKAGTLERADNRTAPAFRRLSFDPAQIACVHVTRISGNEKQVIRLRRARVSANERATNKFCWTAGTPRCRDNDVAANNFSGVKEIYERLKSIVNVDKLSITTASNVLLFDGARTSAWNCKSFVRPYRRGFSADSLAERR